MGLHRFSSLIANISESGVDVLLQEEFNVISPLPIDIKLNHNEDDDALKAAQGRCFNGEGLSRSGSMDCS